MISESLRRLMSERELTPEALAVRMQANGAPVTAGAIRGWLAGTRTPNFANARAAAAALDCTLDALCSNAPTVAA